MGRSSSILLTCACLLGAGGGCGKPDATGGSGGAGAVGCSLGFLGDPGQAVALEVRLRGADGTSSEVVDGGAAPLIEPPQGGRVIFAGVRATNLSACAVEITGALRDTTTNQVRVDVRTTNLHPTGDGWGTSTDSDTSSFSNIPICPNQWASSDAYGHVFELEVSLTDPDGRTGSATLAVEPFCAEPAKLSDCSCQCKQGYQLGQACN